MAHSRESRASEGQGERQAAKQNRSIRDKRKVRVVGGAGFLRLFPASAKSNGSGVAGI